MIPLNSKYESKKIKDTKKTTKHDNRRENDNRKDKRRDEIKKKERKTDTIKKKFFFHPVAKSSATDTDDPDSIHLRAEIGFSCTRVNPSVIL